MTPFETAVLSGWAMANCLTFVGAALTTLRVWHFETVLTSSSKLAGLRRDKATALTLLILVVGVDLLFLLNGGEIHSANL